jgi:ATP-dependent protease ClpP protease subunit
MSLNKTNKDNAEIFLYDMIGGWGITAQQFGKDLRALGEVKQIDLRINSDGGDVFDGRAIFTLLAQHPARVVTHIDGLAASIASLIALSGNEVRAADGSFFMIHNAWGVSIGDAEEMRKTADLLDSVNQSLIDTYQAKTRLDQKEIKQLMSEETWMTATEAKERGFVDVVSEPLKIAALTIHQELGFKNPPQALLPNRVAALSAIQRARAVMNREKGS